MKYCFILLITAMCSFCVSCSSDSEKIKTKRIETAQVGVDASAPEKINRNDYSKLFDMRLDRRNCGNNKTFRIQYEFYEPNDVSISPGEAKDIAEVFLKSEKGCNLCNQISDISKGVTSFKILHFPTEHSSFELSPVTTDFDEGLMENFTKDVLRKYKDVMLNAKFDGDIPKQIMLRRFMGEHTSCDGDICLTVADKIYNKHSASLVVEVDGKSLCVVVLRDFNRSIYGEVKASVNMRVSKDGSHMEYHGYERSDPTIAIKGVPKKDVFMSAVCEVVHATLFETSAIAMHADLNEVVKEQYDVDKEDLTVNVPVDKVSSDYLAIDEMVTHYVSCALVVELLEEGKYQEIFGPPGSYDFSRKGYSNMRYGDLNSLLVDYYPSRERAIEMLKIFLDDPRKAKVHINQVLHNK